MGVIHTTTVAIHGGIVVEIAVGSDYELTSISGSRRIHARLTYRGSSDNGDLNWSGEGPGHSTVNPFCGPIALDPKKIRQLRLVESDPFERYINRG